MLIDNASDCTVFMYMQAKFRNNFKVLIIEGEHTQKELDAALLKICIEYLDSAGIEIESVDDRQEIVKLQQRVTAMQWSIKQQEIALAALGEPFTEGLDNFAQYSYNLQWTGDKEAFVRDLNKIKKRENTYVVQLEDTVAAYNQKEAILKAANRGKVQEIKTEADFVGMLNDVSKFQGYHLKQKDTSMMELALMNKALSDLNARTNNN